MGRALAPLRGENVLISAPGSFHNIGFFGGGFEEPAREFDRWLNETCVGVEPSTVGTARWTAAPSAGRCTRGRSTRAAPRRGGGGGDEPGSGCSP